MVRRALHGLVVAAVCLGLAPLSAFAQDGRGAEFLAAEAAALVQGSQIVRDAQDRGRLMFLASLKLDRIRKGFPRSMVAAELAFGRYGELDAVLIERAAKAWSAANATEAEAIRRGPAAAAVVSPLVPSFGRSGGQPPAPAVVTAAAGQPLTSVQLAERLREAAVFLYIPGRAPGSATTGSGFFISPTHILTNTHVVEGAQKVVVANKSIGVKAARVMALGMSSNVGPDTAVLQIEGWSSQAFLPFAAAATEGESIAIAAYPAKAADGIDRSFMNFRQLIAENRLPTAENIPNVKFDFGFLQSLFVDNTSGIENAQLGVVSAPGSSGSPVVNRCGEVVAQAHAGTKTKLAIVPSGSGFVATGQSMTFSFGIAVRELTKFIGSTSASFTVSRAPCGA